MKTKKLLGLLVVMGSLIMTSCGGQTSKEDSKPASQASSQQPASNNQSSQAAQSSQQGGQSSQAAQSSQAGQSSQAAQSSQQGGGTDTATIEVSALKFETKQNQVYLQAQGTATGYTAATFKWAWGLATAGQQGADPTFAYGSAEPAATDYTAATLGANGAFTVELNLTDITGLGAGLFYVYGGAPGTYDRINPIDASTKAKDGSFRYYIRDDQNAIAIDALPDVDLAEAIVYQPTASQLPSGAQEGVYVKIGGELKAGINTDNLTINADFQRMGQYQKHNTAENECFWTKEGTKAYVNLYIGFMASGENWMTHLGFNVTEQSMWGGLNIPNCVLSNDINDVPYTFDGKVFTVHENTAAGQAEGEAEFYGCLGFKVSDAQ